MCSHLHVIATRNTHLAAGNGEPTARKHPQERVSLPM
jgi:hypothetical protein